MTKTSKEEGIKRRRHDEKKKKEKKDIPTDILTASHYHASHLYYLFRNNTFLPQRQASSTTAGTFLQRLAPSKRQYPRPTPTHHVNISPTPSQTSQSETQSETLADILP